MKIACLRLSLVLSLPGESGGPFDLASVFIRRVKRAVGFRVSRLQFPRNLVLLLRYLATSGAQLAAF